MGVQSGKRAAVRIVTDTTAILPPEYVAAHALQVAPQAILFGEESFLENVTISTEEFIRRLKTSPKLPKTAAPPPGEFARAFEIELKRAKTVISIHPSAEVSGTVRSAEAAKEQWFPNADIRIVDTRTVAGCLGAIVREAVGWAEEGLGADEIVARIDEMAPRSRSYFLVRTLEYLQRGGRIGGAAALLGSVLQIKPILQIQDGRVDVLEKVRVLHKARERLIELVTEQCPPVPAAHLTVMHADAPDEGRSLAEELSVRLGVSLPPIYEVGAAITSHVGPGVLAVGLFVV